MKLIMHERQLLHADFTEKLYKHVETKNYNKHLIRLLLLGSLVPDVS